MTGRPITEDDLQAFVDGALGSERHDEVSLFLASNEDAANRVASYRRDAAALRSALGPIAVEAIPSRLNLANIIEAKHPAGKPGFARWRLQPLFFWPSALGRLAFEGL